MGEKRWQTGARRRNRDRISRDPLSAGWLRPDRGTGADIVIAQYERAHLSAALAALHSAGYGHATRVLDGARGDLPGQLLRSGVRIELGFDDLGPDDVLVLVNTPGRAAQAGDLLLQHAAREVRVIAPQGQREVPAAADVSEADQMHTTEGDLTSDAVSHGE